MKKLTKEEWVNQVNLVHGGKYNYSKVEYIDANTKVCIICPEHGEFWLRPSKHKIGLKCPKCAKVFKHNTKSWIEEATKKHGNRYNYSKVEYKHAHQKVCIICPDHGEFWLTPANHLFGQGCPECANLLLRKDRQWTNDKFIEEAMNIHGDKYDYNKVNYINLHVNVTIICPEHGEFKQRPVVHLRGGCPKCSGSKGELSISEFLDSNNIEYIKEYTINVPKNIKPTGCCRIDFYIPKYNLFIEFNGILHYEPHKYFGGEKGFEVQVKRDLYIKEYSEKHNINLFIIKYNEDVNECLYEFFKYKLGFEY